MGVSVEPGTSVARGQSGMISWNSAPEPDPPTPLSKVVQTKVRVTHSRDSTSGARSVNVPASIATRSPPSAPPKVYVNAPRLSRQDFTDATSEQPLSSIRLHSPQGDCLSPSVLTPRSSMVSVMSTAPIMGKMPSQQQMNSPLRSRMQLYSPRTPAYSVRR